MKLKVALTCAVIALTPTLGMAMGCPHGQEKQVMSCADGTVYDTTLGTCVHATT